MNRNVLVVSVFTAVVSITACTGGAADRPPPSSAPASQTHGDGTGVVFDAAALPALPAAVVLTGADPVARSAELLSLTSDDSADVGPGWITAYAEMGVPVLDPRAPDPAADLVGPGWDLVWSAGESSRGPVAISLADAATALSWDVERPVAAEVVLADLRATGDDRAQTLARFVAGRSVAAGGADPLDPAATAEAVTLDAATVQLLGWVVLRDAMLAGAGAAEGAASRRDGGDGAVVVPARSTTSNPCTAGPNDAAGNDTWAPSPSPGSPTSTALSGLTQSWLPQPAPTPAGYHDRAEALDELASLLASMNGLDLEMAPSAQLVRNKKAVDGAEVSLDITLSYQPRAGAADAAGCSVSYLASALGLPLAVPADGTPIPGTELTLFGVKNFPDKVYFVNDVDRAVTTGADGGATVAVQGKARSKDLPETAKEDPSEFGLGFSAMLDETSVRELFGLAGDADLGPHVSLAATFDYALRDQFTPYTDWRASGYRVDTTIPDGSYNFSGVVCDVDKPFVLQVNGSAASAFVGPMTITPTLPGSIAYSAQGTFGGAAPGSGVGNGTLDVTADPIPLLLDGGQWFATLPIVGSQPVGPGGQHFIGLRDFPILLVPDPTLDCAE